MAKKKAEPTFREMLDEANARIEERRSTLDQTTFYSQLIWDAFCAAFRLSMARDYYSDFGGDLALVVVSPGYAEPAKETTFWPNWPRQRFVVLGHFNFPNRSALKVAEYFTADIQGVALGLLGTTFTDFDFGNFKYEELKRWSIALINELYRRHSPCWPANVTQEDFERLHSQVSSEVAERVQTVTTTNARLKTLSIETPNDQAASRRFEDPIVTITIPRLWAILVERRKTPKLTQFAYDIRHLRRIAERWPIIGTSRKPKHFAWTFVQKFMLDEYEIDIEDPPQIRPSHP